MFETTNNSTRTTGIKSIWLIVCLIIAFLLPQRCLRGQESNIHNAVDRTAPWGTQINPALLSFQNARLSVGLKIFHLDFLADDRYGIRESRLNAGDPHLLPLGIGIGCDIRSFSAGIYSELEGSALLSARFLEQFSVGVKIGVLRQSFTEKGFDLIDADDPLLDGPLYKNVINAGLGVYWQRGRWSFGVGLDHANRPDVGLDTKAKMSQDIAGAVSYTAGIFTPTLLLQNNGRYGFALTVSHKSYGFVKFSYENYMPAKMEVGIHLSRAGSMRYSLDLPNENMQSISMGSHEVSYSIAFKSDADLLRPAILLSTREMRIVDETILRSMSPDLTPKTIEGLSDLASEYLRTHGKPNNLLIIPSGGLGRYETTGMQQQRYADLGEEIREMLARNPEARTYISASTASFTDAQKLREYLVAQGIVSEHTIGIVTMNASDRPQLTGFSPGQEIGSRTGPNLSVETLRISLEVAGKSRAVDEWKLMIYTAERELVNTFRGRIRLPKYVDWNWRDYQGQLVMPGEYSCVLMVWTQDGEKKMCFSPEIRVRRAKRTVELAFRSKLPAASPQLTHKGPQ